MSIGIGRAIPDFQNPSILESGTLNHYSRVACGLRRCCRGCSPANRITFKNVGTRVLSTDYQKLGTGHYGTGLAQYHREPTTVLRSRSTMLAESI